MRKLTQEEVIERFRKVHGDRYDYSLVEYKGNHTNVDIICKDHGVFPQEPASHFAGRGCPWCGGKLKSNTQGFICKCAPVHGDRYDYSKVKYINATTNVTIICKIHGEFPQTPDGHLSGHGCPSCAIEKNTSRQTAKQDEVISRFRSVHNNKYNYSKVEYKTMKINIIVECKIHGDFPVTPDNHLRGRGCPDCAVSGFDRAKPAVFYIYDCKDFIGFGISNKFKYRSWQHNSTFKYYSIDATLLHVHPMSGILALSLETIVKSKFSDKRLNTGIPGFKVENVSTYQLPMLLDFVRDYIENTLRRGCKRSHYYLSRNTSYFNGKSGSTII